MLLKPTCATPDAIAGEEPRKGLEGVGVLAWLDVAVERKKLDGKSCLCGGVPNSCASSSVR